MALVNLDVDALIMTFNMLYILFDRFIALQSLSFVSFSFYFYY